jgi:DNA-binding CsgD family transcriptional regulator
VLSDPREANASSFERRAPGSGEARLLEVVLARQAPDFYVVDGALNVHLRRGDGDGPRGVRQLPLDIALAVQRVLDSDDRGDMTVTAVRRDLAVRVQRLYGGPEPRYAIFLEPYRSRDFVQAAVKRYALTTREATILDLVLRGTPTSEIASRLNIVETTVHQHVKNLGAKVGVTKRNAIVATVLGLVAA